MKHYLVKIKETDKDNFKSFTTLKQAKSICKLHNYKCVNCKFNENGPCICRKTSIYLINEKCILKEGK